MGILSRIPSFIALYTGRDPEGELQGWDAYREIFYAPGITLRLGVLSLLGTAALRWCELVYEKSVVLEICLLRTTQTGVAARGDPVGTQQWAFVLRLATELSKMGLGPPFLNQRYQVRCCDGPELNAKARTVILDRGETQS